jgi:putative phosphoesterase
MRVALISDIHGNFIALERVIEDLRPERVDQVLCLGDVACFGPQPREVVSLLRELKWPVVRGNTDRALLNPDVATQHDPLHMAEVVRWGASQLSLADCDFLRSFAPTIELKFSEEDKLLCFHGSPQSDTEIVLATTPEEALGKIFSGLGAKVLAGGHTHTQMLRRYRDMLILNPGSVGLSHRRVGKAEHIRQSPWAEYALLEFEQSRSSIELKRVMLDPGQLEEIAIKSKMPHAARWATGWE